MQIVMSMIGVVTSLVLTVVISSDLCLINGGRIGVEDVREFFFRAEDGIRDLVRSRGLGVVYKRQGAEPLSRVAPLPAHGQVAVPYTQLTLPTTYSV